MKHSRSSSETEVIHLFIQGEPKVTERLPTPRTINNPILTWPHAVRGLAGQSAYRALLLHITVLWPTNTVVNCSNRDEGTELLSVFFVSGRCRVTEPEGSQHSSSPYFERN